MRLSPIALLVTGVVTTLRAQGAVPVTTLWPHRVDVQAISLLGDTLRILPLAPPVRVRYEQQLADARRAYEHTPANLDSIIWYGRRLGYLGQLRESIAVYTRGLTLFPDDPWLLRHRGHRLLSVRDFAAAVRDLERAAARVAGTPDVVEPDGQPNGSGIPIGTLQSNIGYHLALAHYLQGDWARAAAVAQREVDRANNDDRRVSMGYWLYLSLRRSLRDADAARVLAPMRRDMQILENGAYHRLMLLYKGDLPSDSILRSGPDGALSVGDASAAYGLANWYFYNGQRADAERLWRRIVSAGQWGAFGAIAAEVDLARLGFSSVPKRGNARPDPRLASPAGSRGRGPY